MRTLCEYVLLSSTNNREASELAGESGLGYKKFPKQDKKVSKEE